MSSFDLVILTPEGIAYEGAAVELYVPSSKGPLGILPGYTATISPLVDGVAHVTSAERVTAYFALRHGVLEVRPDKVIVLSQGATRFQKEEDAREFLSESKSPKNPDSEVKLAAAALTGNYADYKKGSYNPK
jgi:F0F1-type ATP synthase epsilon subunit